MKADTYVPAGVPVIRGTNISQTRSWKGDWVYIPEALADSMPRCVVVAGDLVFPHRGSIGEVAIVPTDSTDRYFLSTSLMKIQVDHRQADPLFVYYYFRSCEGRNEILKYGSQVGTPGIGQPLESLRRFCLPLPPMGMQKEISATLGALDDKIDLNRQINETLETMARAIFKDWFVDFGPTRAKMEGRKPYLSPELWALFPDRLDDEGRPEGWSFDTLSEYATLNPEAWSRATYPEKVEYVDLSGTKWGVIHSTEIHGRDTAPSRAQRVLRHSDTIVGTVRPGNGSFGLVGRDGLTGSTGFAVLRPTNPIARELVYLTATQPENIERLSHLADGGAYPAVRPELVLATPIVRSSQDVLHAFGSCVGPIIDTTLANLEENITLAKVRDLLLPKLMLGEISVCYAEHEVKATQ